MTPADLQALLDARAADGCIAALAPLDEARRGKLAKTALAELRSILPVERLSPAAFARMQPDEMQAWLRREAPDPATFRAAQVAVLATASYPQLRRLGRRSLPPLGDALAVLAARRPPWVGEWADLILSWSETDRWALPLADAWVYARGLIRAGLGDRPRTPRYIDGMIVAIGRKGTPRRDLLADPGLLADEVWELFTTEPTPGRREILSVSEYRPPTARWEVALADLAAEGRVDRGRLLDASLDGLERDFHEARARWFALMHETLRPTPQERADRADRLLGLLGSRNASTVLFALKALGPLAEADRLDPGPLLGAIAPALLARPKGTVVLALGLVDRAGGPSAAGTAVDALAHESPAVHRLVVDVVLRHGDRADPALAELVRDRSPGVAASERPRLEAWLGAGPAVVESTSDEVADLIARAATLDPHFATLAGVPAAIAAARRGGGDLAPLRFAAADVPRLDPARRIEPVADLDDLIELFTRVLEGAGAAEDVERLLDGVSRLCDQLPADFAARTAPLRARAAEWGPYGGHLGRLAIAWIDGGPGASRRIHWPDDLFGLFERRAIALADRAIERLAAPLLAAPTHRGGWVDPRVLVDRLRTWADLDLRVDRLDAAQAFLRLAPDRGPRAEALRAAADLAGPVAAALRHALGGVGEVVGPDARLWVAAARARDPRGDDPLVEARHPDLGPDAGRAATYSLRPGPHRTGRWHEVRGRTLVDRTPPPPASDEWGLLTVRLHGSYVQHQLHTDWAALAWPQDRESFWVMGIERLVGHDHSAGAAGSCRPLLEPLLDPDEPLGPMACLLLGGVLAANQPELRGLAVDGFIAAVDDGRLDPEALGGSIAALLVGRLVAPSRLVRSLGEAARVSPLHAGAVARVLPGFMAAETIATRDLAGLLELLHELLIATGTAVGVAGAAAFLGQIQGAGKAATLARKLVKLQPDPASAGSYRAAIRALGGRVGRAERWTRIAAAAGADPGRSAEPNGALIR